MNEPMTLLLSCVLGMTLGVFFFGGLWWTVRKGVSSRRPVLWFLAGLLLRMGVTVAGFYLVGGGQWQRLLTCLIGFVLARLLVTWLTRPSRTYETPASSAGDQSCTSALTK